MKTNKTEHNQALLDVTLPTDTSYELHHLGLCQNIVCHQTILCHQQQELRRPDEMSGLYLNEN